MNTVRPSILQRPVKQTGTQGRETADDAWIKEEKRMEARRARVASYEKQFRVTHTYDATPVEKMERVQGLQRAHDMLMNGQKTVQDRQKELDRKFAENQIAVAKQTAAEEDARARAKKQAEIDAMIVNRNISEMRRTERVNRKRRETELDNDMIQDELNKKRTFLY